MCLFIGLMLEAGVMLMPPQEELVMSDSGLVHTIAQLGEQFRVHPDQDQDDNQRGRAARMFLAGLHGSQIYAAEAGSREALQVVRAIEKIMPGLEKVSAAYLGPEVERTV